MMNNRCEIQEMMNITKCYHRIIILTVGSSVGKSVGNSVGNNVGAKVGSRVGLNVGAKVGAELWCMKKKETEKRRVSTYYSEQVQVYHKQ